MWNFVFSLTVVILVTQVPGGRAQSISSDCGGQLTQQSGVITSPGYPNVYPNNKRCQWFITAADGEVVDLRFNSLDLEGVQSTSGSSSTCPDYVRVYDGNTISSPLITTMCRIYTPAQLAAIIIRSSKNKLLVEFYSDYSGQRPGFVANFWSHECPAFTYGNEKCNQTCNCVRDKTSYCNSTNGVCVCKPGWTGPDCSQDLDECANRTVEACPNNYQECVNTPGSFTCRCKAGLLLNSQSVCEVEVSSQCSAGHGCSHLCAKVQGQHQCYCPDNMKLVGKICQACSNLNFGKDCRLSCYSCSSIGTASCNPATGGCVCKQGWTSTYCNQDINECQQLQIKVCPDPNQVCINTEGGYQCASKNNHFTLTNSSGIIQSPNYPNSAQNVSYSWKILAQSSGSTISFRLSQMSASYSSSSDIGRTCYYGSVDVYDGDSANSLLLAQYCDYISNFKNQPVWSSGGAMYIVFHTQFWGIGYVVNFNGSYSIEDSRVFVSRLTAPSGNIISPGYPVNPSYNVSFWTITVDSFTFITLTLANVSLGQQSCDESYLRIYDGSNLGNTSYYLFCGVYSYALNRTSTYKSLSIIYYAGKLDKQKGFSASYISCNCSSSGTSYCPYQGGPCVCKTGYTGTRCESDIDECQLNMCPQYSQCINYVGSFQCICWNGTRVYSGGSCNEGYTMLTAQSGSFHSQNYPNNYPSYVNYSWIIGGQQSTVVSLKFTDFILAEASKCSYGEVSIYDSDHMNPARLIGQYCGTAAPSLLRSTGDKMRISFKTTPYYLRKGFNATYYSHACPPFMYGERDCTVLCPCAYSTTRLCDNINGVCFCQPGWGGRGCTQDVDECRNSTACPANSDCINEPGTYRCECRPGYQNVSGRCQAMSSCQKIHCSHLCAVNAATGKEQCYCPQDMVLGRDGSTCLASLYPHGPPAADTVVSGKTKTKLGNISMSDPIYFSSDVPVGKSAQTVAYVLYNGVVVFNDGELPAYPDLKLVHIGQQNLLAPLWLDNKGYGVGTVYYHLYESCESSVFGEPNNQSIASPKAKEVMDRAVRDIEKYYFISGFKVSTLLLATWKDVQPKNCPGKDTNTFQSVFISGHFPNTYLSYQEAEEISFVFFIYQEGDTVCLPGQPFDVGISTDSGVVSHQISTSTQHKPPLTGGFTYKGVLTFPVGSKLSASHLCQRYVCNHSDLISSPYFQNEVNQLFQCPCSMDKLSLQWQLVKEDKSTRCYSISAVAKTRLLPNNQRNIMCCYKWTPPKTNSAADQLKAWQAGSFIPPAYYLISDPWQASSVSTSLNPFAYRDAQENMQAQTWCCKKSSQKFCNRFHKVFHSLQCTPFPVFISASALGDPYITTLDGFSYPMNGKGEYVLMEAPSLSFYLQARTERLDLNGTILNGTVFTAFAAKEGDYARFQAQLATTNTTMVVVAQGMDYTKKFYSDVNFDLSDDSLSVRRLNENDKVVVAVSFPCGVSLKIHVGVKSLEIDLEVHNSLQNKTQGLLGNFNNDPHDDFKLPNGTTLPYNMTERQIFEKFSKIYLVSVGSSVFEYNKGENTNNFQDPDFVPLFLDEVHPDKMNQAKDFCGANNTACIYDFLATGSWDFARNTRDGERFIDIKMQALANQPPFIEIVTRLDINNNWKVYEHRNNVLQLSAHDEDGDPVSYELAENFTDVQMFQNGTLTYIVSPVPVSIKIRAKDSKGAYSPLLQINVVVCTDCNRHGECDVNSTEAEFLDGDYRTLKCDCLPAYTGSRCESELDACSLHPCLKGQNCTDLSAAQQGDSPFGFVCGPCPSGTVDNEGACEDFDECLNAAICEQECQNTYRSYMCYCRPGFRLNNVDQRSCIDINECVERTSMCQQQCVNTPGNYTCACNTGYTLAADGRGCVLNSSHSSVCQKCQQACIINNNQVTCDCNIGFIINENDRTKCTDIDECNSGGMSPCSQKCVNTVGRFNCSCYHGYRLDDDGVTCEECESGKYGENCSSTCNCLGRGVCDKVRGCVCDPSWTGTNCDKDVNECLNSSACPSGLVCQNEPGSFRCVCQDGYKLENGTCTDIDECADYNNRCDLKVEVCVNNVGNYSCPCKEGYTRDSVAQVCQDINECELRIDGCDHICENGPGSYRCVCHQGYRLAADQRKCEKYKTVCSLDCSHGCSLDDSGQPVCICPRGYLHVGTNACQDIDECASGENNLCSEKDLCQNLPGDYSCSCYPGFRLENDGRTCVACSGGTWGIECNKSCSCGSKGTIRCDPVTGCVCKPGSTGEHCTETIDRCATGEVTCQTNEECVVSGGNSVCQCRKGFVWSGSQCQDENECLNTRLHDCDQICINTVGSYTCSCFSGYVYNASTNACQDINECEQGHNCSQTCINTAGSYRCSCQAGQFLQPDGVTCGACANGCTTTCNCVEANTASCDTTSGQCVCKPGWTSDDCSVDVDECLTNPCPDYRRCRNLNGSFECVCWNGLQFGSNGTCKDCNRTLTDQTDYLMTSNYPQFYDSNSYCSWKILSNMSNAVIVLSFLDYKTEGCPYDFVTIYDGPTSQSPVLRQVCDNLLGPFTSKGNSMLVIFTSDSSVADRGFRASYTAMLPCKYTSCSHTCQVVTSHPWTEKCTCPDWMKLDPANDQQCVDKHACGSLITEPEGYIVSANYPEMYPTNFNCHWTIQGRKNSVITLSVLDFAVEESDDCDYDYLSVYDGSSAASNVLGHFCGKTPPPSITSTGNSMYIEFTSDDSIPDWGFKAHFVIHE